MTSWSDPLIILTFVIAICTFVYVIVTALIWSATLQNTRATRQMIESSQRPYLGSSSVSISHGHMAHSAIDVKVTNVGSVPGHKVEVNMLLTSAEYTSETIGGGGVDHQIFLLPGKSWTLTKELTDAENDILKKGSLMVEVHIRYHGATDKQHRTDATYSCNDINGCVLVRGQMQ